MLIAAAAVKTNEQHQTQISIRCTGSCIRWTYPGKDRLRPEPAGEKWLALISTYAVLGDDEVE